MARREVIDCDRCDAKAMAEPVRLSVCVGYTLCPAGGSADRDVKYLDLCPKCAAALLSAAVEALDTDDAKKWYEAARKRGVR